jgi:hypothetical protein
VAAGAQVIREQALKLVSPVVCSQDNPQTLLLLLDARRRSQRLWGDRCATSAMRRHRRFQPSRRNGSVAGVWERSIDGFRRLIKGFEAWFCIWRVIEGAVCTGG